MEGTEQSAGGGAISAALATSERPALAPREREALLAASEDLVFAALKRLMAEGVVADRDDLVGFGRQGLVEALERYDVSRGDFRRFAYFRVRGAMVDGLRKMGNWSRRGYERAKLLRFMDSATESFGESLSSGPDAPLGPLATPAAGVDAASVPETGTAQTGRAQGAALSGAAADERLRQHMAAMATAVTLGMFAEGARDGADVIARDTSESVEESLGARQLRELVRGAVAELPEPEGEVIRRHYLGGERLDLIAIDLGCSKSWASRIHTRALGRLGTRLRAHR